MNSRLNIVAHVQAVAGEESMVRRVLESYVAPTQQEDGCLRYDLFADIDDPTKFTFIEEWTDLEALTQHSKSAHLAKGRALLAGKLVGTTWVQKLNQIV